MCLTGLGLLLFTGIANALYSSTSDVVQLTDKTFQDKVINGDGVWMVEFYAPW